MINSIYQRLFYCVFLRLFFTGVLVFSIELFNFGSSPVLPTVLLLKLHHIEFLFKRDIEGGGRVLVGEGLKSFDFIYTIFHKFDF